MKHLIAILLITSVAVAEEVATPVQPERITLAIDGDTGALCYNLINQVKIDAGSQTMLKQATVIDAAKKDLEHAVNETKKENKK